MWHSLAIVAALLSNAGQAGTTLDRGSVILLALQPPAEVSGTLASALADPDPAVRMAAARVAAVNDDRSLVARLRERLALEQDQSAAGEQIRALLLIEGRAAREWVEPHVARIGGRAALTWAEWLANCAPLELAERLSALARSIPRESGSLAPAVARAASDSAARDVVLTAWMEASQRTEWKAMLDRVLVNDELLRSSQGVLLAALDARQLHVREDTVWFIVSALARGGAVPADVLEAALPNGPVGSTVDWTTFGRELIARRASKAALPDRSGFVATQGSHRRLADPSIWSMLTDREAQLARKAFPALKKSASSAGEAPILPLDEIPVRTVSEWMPGSVAATARAAGCTVPGAARFGFARVTYDDRGRVTRTEVDSRHLPEGCHPVIAALARTGLADADRPFERGQQQWQVLPLSQSYTQCTSTPLTTAVPVGDEVDGEVIRTPRKIRDVRPQYPENLRQQYVQGTVVAEAVISETGCVRALRVTRSSGSIGLDLAGIRAVSGWLFEPAAIAGRPLAVYMTVTVNFRLQ